MKNPLWAKAIQNCADPQRARHYHKLLAATPAGQDAKKLSPELIPVLVALFSGSPVLSDWLLANPDCLALLEPEQLNHPRRAQGLRREVEKFLAPALAAREFAGALAEVRRFKQRELLRIAARDLSRMAHVAEITRELSDVADVCLATVWLICEAQFHDRFGRPYHPDPAGRWQQTAVCVLGMGKLGGRELNYSSDVDLLFVYAGEGQVFREPPDARAKPPRAMSSHAFFNRLAENFIAEATRLTPEGTLYRVDLRLRPEGDAGPLCRSLESYEIYYAQWGQIWERMMLIKARCVAGDEILGHEFTEMIQPFRFPRSINARVLNEVAAMKDRIENENLRSGELERNVKLGRGGIREVEFIVQSQQLLHAGRQPFLQISQTIPCLAKLVQYHLLKPSEADQLEAAYCFLRNVEHRLQMEANLQTHTIPADLAAQKRLAKLMGFRSLKAFEAARASHTDNVRRVYDRLLRAETPEPPSPFPQSFDGAEAEWKALLARHWFRDVDTAFRVLREFVKGPGYTHVSSRTEELARQLLPRLFALCRTDDGKSDTFVLPRKVLSDPDRVVTRLDNFISAYGTRATLFELWNSNATFFELLLLLFDRSEFLAETLIRSPGLLDDLVFGGRLTARKTAQEILADLVHGATDKDQFAWLRRYHEAELMRLGLRDILGLVDFEQNLIELSALANACLQYALHIVMREHRLKRPPFAIIGLGKLGGGEINYGSDLDLVFVTETKAKDLPKLQKLAARVMDLLSRRTEQGIVFPTDARLRPDGEKGLLVNTLAAYEAYYRQRAQLWEIQSLTRVRFVAGDEAVGKKFQELAARLTDFRAIHEKPVTRYSATLSPSDGEKDRARILRSRTARFEPPNRHALAGGRGGSGTGVSPVRTETHGRDARATTRFMVRGLLCFTPDWKAKINEMRMRIEKERTPTGQDDLAIKTGCGGLMDAEFIAQTLCLENGWQEAHTLRALERARDTNVLPDAEKLLENYRQLRRVESILRRWSYEGETVLPDDPAPYYRVSVRCGFPTREAFRAALARWRSAIREVYLKVFSRTKAGCLNAP